VKKGFLKKIILLALFCVAFTGVFMLGEKKAYATTTPTPTPSAGSVKVVSVEYYNEQIIVQNNGNSKICFATEAEAAKDNWEVMNADSGTETWIDISWLSSTTENILIIKGSDNPTKSRIILKDKPTKLEVTINYEKLDSLDEDDSIAPLVNIMSSEGSGDMPIAFDDLEWRKGVSGNWQETDTLVASTLSKFLVKGTYLYFRIKAVNDDDQTLASDGSIIYPDGTEGRRFSNEVKVKVAKKATAMVYGIDGEEFTAAIKYGKEYCVTVGSTTTDWIQVTDRLTKTIPLSTVISKAVTTTPIPDGSTPTTAFPAMKIQIRDYATSKAASSKITEISLNAQRVITKDITTKTDTTAIINSGIYVSYNGNKNMILEIPLATPDLPYEYCVVKSGATYDVTKAVWASVTKPTAVKILASKAVEGGTLYVRQKEIKSKEASGNSSAVAYELASTYATCPISYPSIPEIVDDEYTFTKGYSKDYTFTITLNVSGKAAYETAIKSIKLGTKAIDFTPVPSTSGGISIITVTLKATSLTTLTNCYNKAITITYEKGTVDKTSIKLTIQSPVAAGTLTLTNAKGTNTGLTAFTMVSSKASDSNWVYVVTTAAINSVYTVDKVADVAPVTVVAPTTLTGTATSVDNIPIAADQYLTVFEVNATTGYIIKYKSVKITTDYIK
jgi:hypothetical protein